MFEYLFYFAVLFVFTCFVVACYCDYETEQIIKRQKETGGNFGKKF